MGHITKYSQNASFHIKKQAKKRWYNLFVNSIIHKMHIENVFKNKRSNIRLKKRLKIIIKITTDYYKQQKFNIKIAEKVEIS